MGARRGSLGAALGRLDPPPPGVAYHRVLAGPQATALRSLTGVVSALVAFVVLVPLLTQLFIGLAWFLGGRTEGFDAFQRAATAFENPGGMAGIHLALACLTLIAIGVEVGVHRRSPTWLASVEPGVRWRYLVVAGLCALVILNGALWVSRWDVPWDPHPQADLVAFLVVIVLTSPLQALGEEVFFRGYLMQGFGSMVRAPWFAIAASAMVFALFHGTQNLPLFADRFAFGVLAGVLVLVTGGVEAAVAAHVVNNVCAFGYAAFESSVAHARAVQEIGWGEAAFDIGGYAIFTVAAVLMARRMNVSAKTPANP